MTNRAEKQKGEVVAAAAELATNRLDGTRAAMVRRFLLRFYGHVPASDVLARRAEDLYGAAVSLWQFAQSRRPGEAKLRLINPRPEAEGWNAAATIVEIVNDDMPFLVDSVTTALNGAGVNVHLVIHPVLHIGRDAAGGIEALDDTDAATGTAESLMHVEISPVSDPARLAGLAQTLEQVLADVRAAVADWPKMRQALATLRTEIVTTPPPLDAEELSETLDFLAWLDEGNFTFLGYREYCFGASAGADGLDIVGDSGLGVLRDETYSVFDGLRNFATLPPDVRAFLRAPHLLNISKSNRRSTVHRAVRMDTIAVKSFAAGDAAGERLFVGLFTSAAYAKPPRDIPFLRRKVSRTLARTGFEPQSHDGKALLHIIDEFPRDELFQLSEDELLEIAQGILDLQERQRVALFLRRDPFERFVSCFIFVPRERYDTALRQRFVAILEQAFHATLDSFNIALDESVLARIHVILRTTPGEIPEIEVAALEHNLAEAARSWSDRLQEALIEALGEEQGLAHLARYGAAFPSDYRERFSAATALYDIARIEEVRGGAPLAMTLYRPLESPAQDLRLKLYHARSPLALSDILPMLEHMGVKVIAEMPYQITLADGGEPIWMQDFSLLALEGCTELGPLRPRFEDALVRVWAGDMESDGFNRLVLGAGLNARQIVVLRLYAKVMRQAGSSFSQAYMEDALAQHPVIAAKLVSLFERRFDPDAAAAAAAETTRLAGEISTALEGVASLDEDRILRSYLRLIEKSLRTNYYQRREDGASKAYLAVKLASRDIDLLPLPRPLCEIYVLSPRMEGVHLRAGSVARGGIRWSDRKEDFRTEILGLMKAQVVKNAVIVPTGSKGGFVVKRPPADRQALQAEVIECYRTLMRGLLDLTDTIVGDQIVPPPRVLRHDGDDPYLVVAADKGTATFSDIANEIAGDYRFWLGDAFASGGSEGYDHKAMGITARGAWESVKRHFREMAIDVETAEFTCIGVGDMSGDVFGNGMLRSRKTKLVAAFDHRHIFLDPDPDPARSFAERERLFALPRSSWADYDQALLSSGGGVFARSLKAIPLSPEIRARLHVTAERMTPMELIQAILKAPVELLWFGGIGTYVKAVDERQSEVGDRTNDALRIDAAELRVKIIGEGANLAVTQKGRVEYAQGGGRINTDAIDNSAGVSTSDHEVNIKILLNAVVEAGDLTVKQRNTLLHAMTDEVAALVLVDNYRQGLALTLEECERVERFDRHVRLMRDLERNEGLDRAVEFLPDDETLVERIKARQGLTRPELAVLLAYVKIALTHVFEVSGLADDPQLVEDLFAYFPKPLVERFRSGILAHRLRRQIIATVAANELVNRAGLTFARELAQASGRGVDDVARAYMIVRRIYDVDALWAAVDALDNQAPAAVQSAMLLSIRRLIERAAAWFLRAGTLDIARESAAFAPGIVTLATRLDDILPDSHRRALAERSAALAAQHVPEELAARIARLDFLHSAVDIVRLALDTGHEMVDLDRRFFAIGSRFRLDALRAAARKLPMDTEWQKLAGAAVIEDFYAQQAELTAKAVGQGGDFEHWLADHAADLARLDNLTREIESAPQADLAMLAVASRTVRSILAR